jgi:hypothetical protein
VKEVAADRGGMSLSVRMELVECRLTIVGLWGFNSGLIGLETWVIGVEGWRWLYDKVA